MVSPIGGLRRGLVMESSEWLRRGALAATALALLAGVAWALRRRQPALLFGLVWYGVALAPMSGLVRIGAQGWADRYTYLPLVGPTLAVVWIVADQIERLPARSRPPARLAATASRRAPTSSAHSSSRRMTSERGRYSANSSADHLRRMRPRVKTGCFQTCSTSKPSSQPRRAAPRQMEGGKAP